MRNLTKYIIEIPEVFRCDDCVLMLLRDVKRSDTSCLCMATGKCIPKTSFFNIHDRPEWCPLKPLAPSFCYDGSQDEAED